MWFWFSVIALLCWSGSDLFSKIGCREANDKTAHLKMVMAVGIVMGLHACFEIFVNGVEINMQIIMTYLPVSLLYILSMAMGYIGLRYIELSISSPICNSSGAPPEIFLQAPVTHIFPCHNHRTAGKNDLNRQMDPEKEEDQADEGTISDAHARYMEDIVTIPCSQEKESRRH